MGRGRHFSDVGQKKMKLLQLLFLCVGLATIAWPHVQWRLLARDYDAKQSLWKAAGYWMTTGSTFLIVGGCCLLVLTILSSGFTLSSRTIVVIPAWCVALGLVSSAYTIGWGVVLRA